MPRKRAVLEDAGPLTVRHLSDSCLALLAGCLFAAGNLATHHFPLVYQAPGTWPSFCFSNTPRLQAQHTSLCLESMFPDLCVLGSIIYFCFNSRVTSSKRTHLITLQNKPFISITLVTTRSYLVYLYTRLFSVSPPECKHQESLLVLFLANVRISAQNTEATQ